MSEATALLVRYYVDGRQIRSRPGGFVPPIGALLRLGDVWRVERVEADLHQLVCDVHLVDARGPVVDVDAADLRGLTGATVIPGLPVGE
jgi:hypothetical protein